MEKIRVQSLDDLPQVAEKIIQNYSEKIIAFYGEMGAGKTTFIKVLCQHLGVPIKEVCSPTYAIVNEYPAKSKPIFHFDFYRIKDEQEVFDMGYEEYFYSGNYCFVEWPEKITNLLPDKLLKVSIEIVGEERVFTIEVSKP